MAETDFAITFVRFKNETQQQTKLMQGAYTLMTNKGFHGNWMDEANLLDKQWKTEDLFIFSKFEGNAFEFLKEGGYRVITPYVIMYCEPKFVNPPFHNIPKRDIPIYSQCMRGLTVSASNLSSSMKKEISDMVFRMSGYFAPTLTEANNFLVTDSVLTAKYRAAKQLSTIKIVKPDWVYHCDEKFQQLFKRADDPEIVAKYELPILFGLTICVSGLEQRDEIEKIVKDNGGEYSKALNLSKSNTYLLLNEPVGEKYKYASKKNFPCLRVEWLYDSIKNNVALPVTGYELQPPMLSDIPTIKSEQSTRTVELGPVAKKLMATNSNEPDFALLIKDKTKDAIFCNPGKFLEDCIIHPIGFDQAITSALKSAAIIFGGIVMEKFQPIVTHVIVGPSLTMEKAKKFADLCTDKFVTIDWFLSCLEKTEMCSNNQYKYDIKKMQPLLSKTTTTTTKAPPPAGNNLNDRSNEQNKPKGISSKQIPVANTLEELKKVTNFPTKSRLPPPVPMDIEQNFLSLEPEPPNANRIKIISPRRPLNSLHQANSAFQVNRPGPSISPAKSSHRTAEPLVSPAKPSNPSRPVLAASRLEVAKPHRKPVIKFTAFNVDVKDNERYLLGELIAKAEILGARVIKSNDETSESCTHLVAYESYLTERLLTGIAAGVWVVNVDFIKESAIAGKFIDETRYEWKHIMNNQGEKKILSSGWRQRFQKTGRRAFEGMVLVYINQHPTLSSNIAVARAGGAKVHQLDDYVGSSAAFEELLAKLNYAVAMLPIQDRIPNRTMRLLESIESSKRTIINGNFFSKCLLQTPETQKDLLNKSIVTCKMIKDQNAKFH